MKAKNNPFSSSQILKLRYRLQGESWESLLEKCRLLNYRSAIVGPHGSRKTSLLEELANKLGLFGIQSTFVRFNDAYKEPDWTLFRKEKDRSRNILLIDGAEQLSRKNWAQLSILSHSFKGLIVTTHSSGLLPTLIECHVSDQPMA